MNDNAWRKKAANTWWALRMACRSIFLRDKRAHEALQARIQPGDQTGEDA
jgi:hypothetical protein